MSLSGLFNSSWILSANCGFQSLVSLKSQVYVEHLTPSKALCSILTLLNRKNLVLPKVGAANWLSFLGLSFGAILIGMGFTYSWQTMAVCRVLLGVFEAGFLPGEHHPNCLGTELITDYRRLYLSDHLLVHTIRGRQAAVHLLACLCYRQWICRPTCLCSQPSQGSPRS